MPLPSTVDQSAVGDDQPAIRRMVADFVAHRVTPQVGGLDAHSRFPGAVYRDMAGLNLFGITVPEKHGGVGARALDYLHVMEGLSYGYASVADQCGLVELVSTLWRIDVGSTPSTSAAMRITRPIPPPPTIRPPEPMPRPRASSTCEGSRRV